MEKKFISFNHVGILQVIRAFTNGVREFVKMESIMQVRHDF